MNDNYEYLPKSIQKLKQNFTQRKSKGVNSFLTIEDYLDWYNSKEKKCFYCGIEESILQEIVMTGILKSARFPENGTIGRGQSRGVWLEVDRLNPKGNYSRENCVLACYFCNNDKSDVFHGTDYNSFNIDRPNYLRALLKKHSK